MVLWVCDESVCDTHAEMRSSNSRQDCEYIDARSPKAVYRLFEAIIPLRDGIRFADERGEKALHVLHHPSKDLRSASGLFLCQVKRSS